MTSIRISWPGGSVIADLDTSPTVERLLAALPCTSDINTWGEEVYFSLPIRAMLEPGAQQVVPPGTVCFWVDGSALALPWHCPGDAPRYHRETSAGWSAPAMCSAACVAILRC